MHWIIQTPAKDVVVSSPKADLVKAPENENMTVNSVTLLIHWTQNGDYSVKARSWVNVDVVVIAQMVRPTLLVATRKVDIGEEVFVDYGVSRMAAHEIPGTRT